jgi:hypothetical protein
MLSPEKRMDTITEVKLEHVFDVRVDFGAERTMWPVPGGAKQGYTPAIGGIIEGPRLKGRVVPHSGADFANVRGDGVVELNAHYLFETDDGALIYIHNRGYIVPGPPLPKGKRKPAKTPQPAYFRFTPTFRAPTGPHDWLNRTLIVGGGERRSNPDHSIFRYYAVL